MADRPHRGGGGGGGNRGNYRGRGGGDRGGRGGRGGDHHHGGKNNDQQGERERPKKENILDLAKYMDKEVQVKFNGGREVIGTLKGYDALMNLVLDEVKETMRGKSHSSFEGYADYSGRDEYQATALGCWRTRAHKPPYPLTSALRGKDEEGNESSRPLGLVVVRGTLLVAISPTDGSESIANPFLQQGDDE
ncbi:hypothetical protein OOU_Y34scaffold00645g12 [Pyricularia oryzae Y34]|uniref:Sm domain-containing protein n=1 Tax=Pyricularia oryzae (strain Y34) TaxID=1143189 RepID=A0AA97NUS2_PYRO3|nr:hypothetical protein OOU_Y34scaffold00645g12 [Pyricularia oryzae Y34]